MIYVSAEKSYFIIETKRASNDDIEDHAAITQSIYNGFVKCLEDYAGEIKHSKVIQKEVFAESSTLPSLPCT